MLKDDGEEGDEEVVVEEEEGNGKKWKERNTGGERILRERAASTNFSITDFRGNTIKKIAKVRSALARVRIVTRAKS